MARDVLGEEPMDTTEEVTERVLREERATQVRAALEVLSEEHRAILVLREMEGLCYEEIADVLGLLRFLDNVRNDAALFGVLRSPFFLVSDEGLLRLRRAGGETQRLQLG